MGLYNRFIFMLIIITIPKIVVSSKRNAVTKLNERFFNIYFPSTVELPQQRAASIA